MTGTAGPVPGSARRRGTASLLTVGMAQMAHHYCTPWALFGRSYLAEQEA